MAAKITKELINDFFEYNELSGFVTIKMRDSKHFNNICSESAFKSRYAGKRLKTKDKDGYLIMTVLGNRLTGHRIAYILKTGDLSIIEIDHINGLRDDNRWCNIRVVTRSQNMKNKSVSSVNTSGVMGVSLIKETNKWRSRISARGNTTYHLGVFDNWFDAVCSRKSAEYKYNYHANHGKPLIIQGRASI